MVAYSLKLSERIIINLYDDKKVKIIMFTDVVIEKYPVFNRNLIRISNWKGLVVETIQVLT